MNADPRVMEYFPAALTRAESDAMADRCQLLIDKRGWGFWAVEYKSTHEFIGFVGLHTPSADFHFLLVWKSAGAVRIRTWGRASLPRQREKLSVSASNCMA